MHKRNKGNKGIMERFWAFLRVNIIWCIIGTAIYWGIPYIVVTFLGIFVNKWFFTIFAAVFGVQVMLPAIPIIIGISLGVKGLFTLLHKKK